MPPPRHRRPGGRDVTDPLPIGTSSYSRGRGYYQQQQQQQQQQQPARDSPAMARLKQAGGMLRAVAAWLLRPQNVWLLLFLPSFFRYMVLLRGSLRPRPLTVGSIVDHGGGGGGGKSSLAALVDLDHAKIEVVTEGLEGVLDAPLWRHDPVLGRGYLLFSQPSKNRLWRWEAGGGAFTIGRSLFLEHAGCVALEEGEEIAEEQSQELQEERGGGGSGGNGDADGAGGVACDARLLGPGRGGGGEGLRLGASLGVSSMALMPPAAPGVWRELTAAARLKAATGSSKSSKKKVVAAVAAEDAGAWPAVLCEGGGRRVVRLEANGTRTALAALPSRVLAAPRAAAFGPDGALFLAVVALPSGPGEQQQQQQQQGATTAAAAVSDGRVSGVLYVPAAKLPPREGDPAPAKNKDEAKKSKAAKSKAAAAAEESEAAAAAGSSKAKKSSRALQWALRPGQQAATTPSSSSSSSGAAAAAGAAAAPPLRRPVALAFSPDFERLYVADADPADPHWRVYDVAATPAAPSPPSSPPPLLLLLLDVIWVLFHGLLVLVLGRAGDYGQGGLRRRLRPPQEPRGRLVPVGVGVGAGAVHAGGARRHGGGRQGEPLRGERAGGRPRLRPARRAHRHHRDGRARRHGRGLRRRRHEPVPLHHLSGLRHARARQNQAASVSCGRKVECCCLCLSLSMALYYACSSPAPPLPPGCLLPVAAGWLVVAIGLYSRRGTRPAAVARFLVVVSSPRGSSIFPLLNPPQLCAVPSLLVVGS